MKKNLDNLLLLVVVVVIVLLLFYACKKTKKQNYFEDLGKNVFFFHFSPPVLIAGEKTQT